MLWAVSMLAVGAIGCSTPKPVEEAKVACAPMTQPEATKATGTAAAPVVTPGPIAVASKVEPKAAEKKEKSHASHELKVKRFVVATGMNKKQPEGTATLFRQSEIEKLYAYLEIENDGDDKEKVTVSFEPPDGRAARGNVTLDVGSSKRWRTWAYTKQATQVGSWTAVVKDEEGHTLARQPFEIAL